MKNYACDSYQELLELAVILSQVRLSYDATDATIF